MKKLSKEQIIDQLEDGIEQLKKIFSEAVIETEQERIIRKNRIIFMDIINLAELFSFAALLPSTFGLDFYVPNLSMMSSFTFMSLFRV